MHKYRAIKTVCLAGHTHPSKSEAKRCDQLCGQERAGAIEDLQHQPVYPLIVNEKLVCKYVADFRYTIAGTGLAVVEDVKGMATPIFNLKRKLVEALYPGVVVTVWPPKVRNKRKAKKGVSEVTIKE